MMRVVVLAPIKTSLYSRLVTHLVALEPGVKVTDVIVRTPWTIRRIRGEIRRDGVRLLRKVYNKMVLGKKAYDERSTETLLAMARRFDLPGRTLADLTQVHSIRLNNVKDHNDAMSQAILENAQPDVIAFTGGGLIRNNILQLPKLGVLNCHMGILPQYRGMDVVEWPVAECTTGSPAIGLTIHFMDEGVDTGPILLHSTLALRKGDTFQSMRIRLEPMMVGLVLDSIRGLRDGKLIPKTQSLNEGRQYFVMHPRMVKYAENQLVKKI